MIDEINDMPTTGGGKSITEWEEWGKWGEED